MPKKSYDQRLKERWLRKQGERQKAYNVAAAEHFGEFAYLNKV